MTFQYTPTNASKRRLMRFRLFTAHNFVLESAIPTFFCSCIYPFATGFHP
jgi:hypothetical protein